MSLYDELQRAKSEEDVKDAYIGKLWLTNVSKGEVDIKCNEAWFEAKDGHNVSSYKMFTQLLHYVDIARKKGERLPPLLGVFDQKKAALMKTSSVIDFLKEENIKWSDVPSNPSPESVAQISQHIGTHFREFNLEPDGGAAFIEEFMHARRYNKFLRREITQKNLKHVFELWVEMIGREIDGIGDKDRYRLLFFTDIMHDGKVAVRDDLPAKLLFDGEIPFFELDRRTYWLNNTDGYRQFWMLYNRPPEKKCQKNLMRRGDKLIPRIEREFKGAYYTPDWVVEKAYDTLTKTLGADWQKEYIVWDMCCGVGNLEEPHSNPRNIFMSTLDEAEVKLIKSQKVCFGAKQFQYDYLNEDITDKGKIDYSITKKIPKELQEAIKTGKKILVLMNPPYAEATNANRGDDSANKIGVAKTHFSKTAMQDFGKSRNELFVQFLTRISKEIPTATIAMFSKLKYINAPSFKDFRQYWNAEYLDGFIVHSKNFNGLRGDFPIGFLVWKTHHDTDQNYTIDTISTEALNEHGDSIGYKNFYNKPNETMLHKWIDRPRANDKVVIPLKNAVSPSTSKAPLDKWSDDAIAYMLCNSNDFQQASTLTALFSSCFGSAHGFYVTPDNLEKAAMTFTARLVIKPTWVNDRDQFFIPTEELTDEFKNDCLIWMLFHGNNLTAGADGLEWKDKKWSMVNHFIPFSETEVNAPKPFKSTFMIDYLADKKLSSEAELVKTAGRILWQTYFSKKDPYKVRDDYKLGRSDVGWYQIRRALDERNKEHANAKAYLMPFKESYEALSAKIRPQIFDLGFLRK